MGRIAKYYTHAEKVAERAAEMKARNENKIKRVPSYYADTKIRSERLIKLRELMGITIAEFAAKLGTTPGYHKLITTGHRECPMSQLYLAERIYQAYRQKQIRLKAKEDKRKLSTIGQQLVVTFVPLDDPELRAKAIKMHIIGRSAQDIAQELALSPDTVQHWLSSIA